MPSGQDTEPRVWVVSAEHWPRAYLRAELIERGYDAVGFETVRDAVARRLLDPRAKPELLVIDLQNQELDERARAFFGREAIPILVVAGSAQAGLDAPAPVVETLHRPLTIGAIADAVDRRMGRTGAPAPSPLGG